MNAQQLADAKAELRSHESTIRALEDRIARSREEIDTLTKAADLLRPQIAAAETAALKAQLAAAEKAAKPAAK